MPAAIVSGYIARKYEISLITLSLIIIILFSRMLKNIIFIMFNTIKIETSHNPKSELIGRFFIILIDVTTFILSFSYAYVSFGLISSGNEIKPNFTEALYFSIVTWTSVGYGDFVPSIKSRTFAEIESISGYILFALLVAALISLIQRLAIQLQENGSNTSLRSNQQQD